MRVLYDGIVFQNSYQRGIQRVFRELIDHLPADIDPVLALTDRPKSALPSRANIARALPRALALLPRKPRRALGARIAPPRLRRLSERCQVFHSTYYTLPPRDMPTVLHVHDLIPERFPQCFDPAWATLQIEQRRRCIAQATRIITISNATAADIARFYPSAAGRTTTVYLGCEHIERGTGLPARVVAQDPYALFVGDRAGYKNFTLIPDAMCSPGWPSELHLRVAGPAWSDRERTTIEPLVSAGRVRHLGRPSDDELSRHYAHAACVLVPSLIEGFGFPVLEAQAAGVPLVCSDIPVFREVAADGAVYFDVSSPTALTAAVRRALDPATAASTTAAAQANLSRFSWSRCASEVAAMYRSLAG